MDAINPYSSPRETSGPDFPPDSIQVDGRFLIVGSSASLPMRCAVTNQSVTSSDLVTRTLRWAPSFRLVLAHHTCTLSYYINANRRRRGRILRWVLTITAILAVVVAGLAQVWWIILGLIALPTLVPRDPLSIKMARDGRFWIAGCSDAFLRSCETELESADGFGDDR